MKTIEQHFADWESDVFGFGYGTGETPVLEVLHKFLALCEPRSAGSPPGYWHSDLEAALGAPITWLLINALCHADIIEYGTSPRGGWLTKQGVALKNFVCDRTVEQPDRPSVRLWRADDA